MCAVAVDQTAARAVRTRPFHILRYTLLITMTQLRHENRDTGNRKQRTRIKKQEPDECCLHPQIYEVLTVAAERDTPAPLMCSAGLEPVGNAGVQGFAMEMNMLVRKRPRAEVYKRPSLHSCDLICGR